MRGLVRAGGGASCRQLVVLSFELVAMTSEFGVMISARRPVGRAGRAVRCELAQVSSQ
jgi:hypothetical protein